MIEKRDIQSESEGLRGTEDGGAKKIGKSGLPKEQVLSVNAIKGITA